MNEVYSAKLQIISAISKEYFKVIDLEDVAVANLAALTGGKQLDIDTASFLL